MEIYLIRNVEKKNQADANKNSVLIGGKGGIRTLGTR
jgi:hypothetical protein